MRTTTAFYWTNAAIMLVLSVVAYAPVGLAWSLAVASAGLVPVIGVWFLVRRIELPATTLLAIQAALVLHYVGLVPLEGGRVYAMSIGWLRYDKVVHAGASFFGVFGAAGILRYFGARLGKAMLIALLFIVIGCGALVENIEYAAMESYGPHWDGWLGNETLYDNDMQDMVANLAGAALGLAVLWLMGGFRTPLAQSALPDRPTRSHL